jgi:hypothetical protein
VQEHHGQAIGIPALLDVQRVAVADVEAFVAVRFDFRVQLAHERLGFLAKTSKVVVLLNHDHENTK